MVTSDARFFYDFVDPLSFLVERELAAVEEERGIRVPRVPLELRPPPAPLLDPDGAVWRARWEVASRASRATGVTLVEPALVPWSRKAHELVLHAMELGQSDEIRRGIFALVFEEGRDIGRVDVLVDFARKSGMDLTRAKAVLDVDRHAEEVAAARSLAADAGVGEPPALVRGHAVLRGFHNRDALGNFLG